MSKYALVRGWIECSFEDVTHLKKIIFEHWEGYPQYKIDEGVADLYKNGWVFPAAPINWISLIFFGANINETSVPFFWDCLQKIARSNLEVDGFFYFDNEEQDQLRKWLIANGELVDSPR